MEIMHPVVIRKAQSEKRISDTRLFVFNIRAFRLNQNPGEELRFTNSKTKSATTDSKRLIDRVERTITYFIDHTEEVYKLVIAFAVALNLFGLIGMLRLLTAVNFIDGVLGVYGLSILYPLLTAPLSIAFGWIARKDLIAKRPQGITAFAIILFFESLNGHSAIVLLGLYAIFNRGFRRAR